MARNVEVTCKWESKHTIEVPNDTAKFEENELEELLEVSGDDVTSSVASLIDWKVDDDGPR